MNLRNNTAPLVRDNENNKSRPDSTDLVTIVETGCGETVGGRLKTTTIFFVTKGRCLLHMGKTRKTELPYGSMAMLPIACDYRLEGLEKMAVTCFSLFPGVDPNELTGSTIPPDTASNTPYPLPMNDRLWMFLNNTISFVNDGLGSGSYQKMKTEEFLLLLRAYYPMDKLTRFLGVLNGRNARLARTVYMNWDKTSSLDELADLAGLSLSGFAKRFKKIFGISPYQWVMERKSERIYKELTRGVKSIRQLTEEYDFYSVQHFGYYCKKRFGLPPGKIRKSAELKGLTDGLK